MKKLITSGIISLAMASALMAAEGDIVFVIDESGSMRDHQQTVINNLDAFVQQLESNGVDYQLGLVGFGWGSTPNPHVVTKLTPDKATFLGGLNSLIASGGYEPGFAAVSLSLSADMEPESFRPDAGTCVIMITNEDADDPQNQQMALDALDAKGAIYYGIVDPTFYNTPDHYGMNQDSLAEATGGAIWDISQFDDPIIGEAIMAQVMEKCISEAIVPDVNFDIHPQSCPNPLSMKSKGVTPMAILGTEDFDVADINVSTLQVNGESPVMHAYEDVAEPYAGEMGEEPNRDECWEYEAIVVDGEEIPYAGDGFMDLTLKFTTREILNDVEKGVQMMEITGQKLDGSPITGTDVVWVK